MKSIRKFSLYTTVAIFSASGISVPLQAALSVVLDHDFQQNQAPPGFTEVGDPLYADGKLLLDGNSYLQAGLPADLAFDNNFVLEVIARASDFGAFNFVATISPSNKSNFGFAVLAAGGGWGALTSSSAFAGSTPHGPAPTEVVALAYVFENGDASLYVDGVKFDSGGGNTFNLSFPAMLSIGAHPFDAPNGLFKGSIERVRFSTFDGSLNTAELLGPGDGVAPLTPSLLIGAEVFSISENSAFSEVTLLNRPADVTLLWATNFHNQDLAAWLANGAQANLGTRNPGIVGGALTGLVEDTRYFYRFLAVDGNEDPVVENWSEEGTSFVTPLGIRAVTDLAATPLNDYQVELTWSDVFQTELQYLVERSYEEDFWVLVATLPANTTSYIDDNLQRSTTYRYRIVAVNKISESGLSNLVEATTPDSVPFAASVLADYDFNDHLPPTGLTAAGSPTFAGGKLLLDGRNDYLQGPSPLTASDNYVLEAVVEAESFGNFNFVVSISNADRTNSGFGLVAEAGNWNALNSGQGVPGSAPHAAAPTPAVALAYVRERGNNSLYVNGVLVDSGQHDNLPGLSGNSVITIGGHPYDAPNGLFHGAVDRVRVSTFTGTLDPAFLLSPAGTTEAFATWITGFNVGGLDGFDDDADGDGLPNGIEYLFGTHPGEMNAGLRPVPSEGNEINFEHPGRPLPPGGVAATYEWSVDLSQWHESGQSVNGSTVGIQALPGTPAAGTTTVRMEVTGTPLPGLYLRVKVAQMP